MAFGSQVRLRRAVFDCVLVRCLQEHCASSPPMAALIDLPELDGECAHELLRVACLNDQAAALPLQLRETLAEWVGRQSSVLISSDGDLQLLWLFLQHNIRGDAGYVSATLHASILEALALVPRNAPAVGEALLGTVTTVVDAARNLQAVDSSQSTAAVELLQTACVLTARLGSQMPASARRQLAATNICDHPLQTNLLQLLATL